jgi:hypothetical protein
VKIQHLFWRVIIHYQKLPKQFKKRRNKKYGCIQASDNLAAMLDSNIIYDIPYFSMASICEFQLLVPMKQIELITQNTKQLFVIKTTGEKVASIISQDFIDGRGDGTGLDHCGTGKEREIYTIMEAYAIKSKNEEIYEETKEETKAEPQTNTVKIQYSWNNKSEYVFFEIQPNKTKIGDIKVKLLTELGLNESEYNVRIIFLGQIRKDNVFLSNLGSGITLQAQVNKIPTGGKRTKKRNRRKKSVTRKRNIRRKNKKTKKH